MAIARSGRAAALDVAEHDDPRVHAESLLGLLGDADCASGARTFRHYDDRRALAAMMALLQLLAQVVKVNWYFGNDDRFGAAADRDFQRDEARVAAHPLDEKQAF